MIYDAIIVGGGPAGLQCARKLSSYGYKIILFEKNKIPGESNYSTAGIPKEAFDNFMLSNDCIGHSFSKTSFITPKQTLLWDFKKITGYVLDFKKMKLALAKDINSKKGIIKYDAKVTDIKTDKEGISNIIYTKNNTSFSCKAKYYIDASGFSAVLASKVGLRKLKPCSPAVGIERVIKIKLDDSYKNKLCFYFGDKYVPYGYAWVFHFGEDIYKIGVCTGDAERLRKEKNHLNYYLNEFVSGFGEGKLIEEHGGSIFVNGGYKKNTWKNIIMIGDTGSTIHPLLGEGIRHALYSGDFAAETIHKCETEKTDISHYDILLHQYRKNNWFFSYIIAKSIYFSNDTIRNFLIGILGKLNPEELYKYAYCHDHKLLIKNILF